MTLDGFADRDAHASALTSLVQHGVSETLIGAFQALAEQTESDGRLRHPPAALRALRQAVLCRSYAAPTLELGWLLSAIAGGQPGNAEAVLRAFYIDNIGNRARFASAVNKGRLPLASGCRLDGSRLHLAISGSEFVLHLDRMPLLTCLLELLVFIDPSVLRLAAPGLAPKTLASELQKRLYAFLAEHAQPLHQQRRFHGLLDWLRAEVPELQPFEAIDDARILAYWCAPPEGSGDVSRLRTVAEAFLHLREALALGAQAAASGHALPFEELEEVLVCGEDIEVLAGAESVALDGLTTHPRFLTARVAQELESMARFAEAPLRHPLTLVRVRVWGALQSRLIEARKRRQALPELLPEPDYAGWATALREIGDELDVLSRASVGVLLAQGASAEALSALLDLEPDLSSALRVLADDLPDPSPAAFAAARLREPRLNDALKRVEAALKSTARAGFKGADDYAEAAVYIDGVADLRRLQQRLKRLLTNADQWSSDFAADLPIVRKRLTTLHAGDQQAHD